MDNIVFCLMNSNMKSNFIMNTSNIYLLLLILFKSHLLFGGIHVEAQSSNVDKEALLSFKQKVDDPQNFLSNWTRNTSHCTWYGVSCSDNDNLVHSLNLTNLGLAGVLPSELSNLTSLQILDLSKNSFYGPIPGTLSNCRNLKMIKLQVNNFTGSLPREIGYLSRLQILDFSVNNLSGVIPQEFGNLSSLVYIAMARNQLRGQIPWEFGHLQNLQKIQLSENLLSGDIPDSIFNISSIVYISVTKNNLTGKLPTNFGLAVPNLTSLYLAANRLEGKIPKSLSNISSLQYLDLSNNKFHGYISYLGNMKHLTYLDLGMNALSSNTEQNSELIGSLKNCTRLESLLIDSNNLAGKFPSSMMNLSNSLQDFCIGDNSFTGTFPLGIDLLPNLISLSIENNYFTGKLPKSLSILTKLQIFLVYSNTFSGEIPDFFNNFKQLYSLGLQHNQFSGSIPKSIGECKNLAMLSFSMNKFNGTIPREIFMATGLIYMNLSQNVLRGPLPSDVGSLQQITSLDISDNQLSGNLSSSLGECVGLKTLSLARNKFTGAIPKSIGNLASLERLDLSSNNLTNQIPEELANLSLLQSLNLSFNQLEGKIPTTGVFKNLSRESLRGNDELCSTDKDIARRLGLSRCKAKKSYNHILLKILIPVGAILSIIVISFFVWTLIFRKKGEKVILPYLGGMPLMISYSGIRQATNNFAPENLIGKGAFGSVYKGILSGNALAFKVLDLELSCAEKSFDVECEALKNIRHRNLVKVITSCSSIAHGGSEFKALVMEFMVNGNLDQWLYPKQGNESSMSLTLLQRLSIAIEVAYAMDYLHNDCYPPIVHCDLKPANVLLDDNMVARVGDFGLARFVTQNQSQNGNSTIGLKGSIGYIAPEYGLGGRASASGDVYSYGILLLEMFIAKHPTDELFKEGLNLNNFASSVNDNSHVIDIADSRLFSEVESSSQSSNTCNSYVTSDSSCSNGNRNIGQKSEECIAAVLKVGLSCAVPLAKDRLSIREALAKLLEIQKSLCQQL